jgi:hypothetical protein
MSEDRVADRLAFLAKEFDVFECDLGEESLNAKIAELVKDGFESVMIKTNSDIVIGILSKKRNKKERTLKRVSISSDVFVSIIAADPTENKMCVQWMLTIFSRLIKEEKAVSVSSAVRFVEEDMPQASIYLSLFEDNKRKKKFIELCKGSYILKHVGDPTNINQYKSLSQLFDAVDPFIEKEPSALERTLAKYIITGQAECPVRDRKFTLYIPKTTSASVVFKSFTSWCTAREGNSMFNSYTADYKKPNGKNSDIYIIIDNKFFTGESKELYQIHFETDQIKDRSNSQVKIFENVIAQSEGLSNFFYEELMGMAKSFKKGIDNNKYLNFLIQFGFTESLFELYDEKTPTLVFMDREIPKLPDMSKFKELDELVICNGQMVEVHPSIGKLTKLNMVVFPNNKLKSIPREIGALKNMIYLNLVGNPLKDIPSDLSYLDKSNGGSLERISVKDKNGVYEMGDENYQKLKKLLPTTIID